MDFITYAAAVAAAKKMGGGGSGVGSWDDLSAPMPTKFLPDGVPYVEEGGMVELPVTGQWYENTDEDGNVTDSGYTVTAPIGLQIGITYIVNWNGTNYEVTGQDFSVISGGEMQGVFLGNLSIVGGDDTGEPFAMMVFPADIAAEMGAYCQIVSLDMSINIPFTIYGGNVTIHKIDPRCLPDDIGGGVLTVTVDISTGTANKTGVEICAAVKAGKSVLIDADNTIGTCISCAGEEIAIFSVATVGYSDGEISSVNQLFVCVDADGKIIIVN